MKLTAPRIDDAPVRCSEKIARSTDAPAWAIPLFNLFLVRFLPCCLRVEVRDGGRSQNVMLFIRGNAISGAPSIRGTSQFPNPPIIIGITIKKIITKARAFTIT